MKSHRQLCPCSKVVGRENELARSVFSWKELKDESLLASVGRIRTCWRCNSVQVGSNLRINSGTFGIVRSSR